MRRLGFLVVLLLGLAACTSSPSGTAQSGSAQSGSAASGTGATAAPTPSTGAGTAGDSPFGPLPPGITVKVAFTSVMVQVTNPPTFPFHGSDGRFHVAYNVVLQNASRVPATIRKLEVVDATDATKVIASFAGKQLVDP